jgi:membrane fusion protein YbhG
MGKTIRWSIIGIFIILFVTTIWLMYEHSLRKKSVEGFIETSGRIEGIEVEVGTKVEGRIKRLLVKEGDTVNDGDTIALISSEQIKASVDAAKAKLLYWENKKGQAETDLMLTRQIVREQINKAEHDLEAAHAELEREKATLETGEKNFEGYTSLLQQNVVSKSLWEKFQLEYISAQKNVRVSEMRVKQAEAYLVLVNAERLNINLKENEVQNAVHMLESARAELEEREATLADTKLTAPSSGIILQKIVEPGEIVTVGTPVVRMVDPGTYYLEVYIPNQEVGKIQLGNTARIYPDALPDKIYDATVTYVSDRAEFTPKNVETKQQRVELVFKVKLGITNPDRLVKDGMPAEACIRYDEKRDWSECRRK